jgi:hypothetical protein
MLVTGMMTFYAKAKKKKSIMYLVAGVISVLCACVVQCYVQRMAALAVMAHDLLFKL